MEIHINLETSSLKELRKTKEILKEKIQELQNKLYTEIREKVLPLLIKEDEIEQLQKERFSLDYGFYEQSFTLNKGHDWFNTYYDWEKEEYVGSLHVQGYRSMYEKKQMENTMRWNYPLFFKISERVLNKELNQLMEEYEDSGLVCIELINHGKIVK